MIVADTGAILALLDRNDRHHKVLRTLFEEAPDAWILPWAILPEVDYLTATHLSTRVRDAFLGDLGDGLYNVAFGSAEDLTAAQRIHQQYLSLNLGLVDACVMAMASRLRADAIATLDIRHFGAVKLTGKPKLLPRDV